MEHFNLNREKKSNNKALIIAILFIASFFILSFNIPESYFFSGFFTYDSAWNFLCAKAWLAGLQPYVDFSDSKGPLLWGLYIISAKIHAYSFIGTFWILTCFYTTMLWYVYLSFNIFIKNHLWSVIGTLLLLSELFIVPSSRLFIHTEDFSLMFFAISFYYTFKFIYEDKGNYKKVLFILGCCFGAIFLLKFFTASLFSGFLIVLTWKAYKEKVNIIKLIFYFIAGAITVCSPFFIYFIYIENIVNFFNEYIFKTFQSHSNGNYSALTNTVQYIYIKGQSLVISIAGLLYFIKKQQKNKYVPLILFIPFWLSEFASPLPQYGLPSHLFFFFTLLIPLQYAQKKQYKAFIGYIFSSFMLILAIVYPLYKKVIKNYEMSDFFTVKNETNTAFAKYNYLIAQKPHARLLYKKIVVTDWGFQPGSLPACKYFAPQYGETQEMTNNKIETVLNKKADFVCSIKEDTVFNAFLTKHGYIEYYYENPNGYTLFSKYKLKEPAKDYCLSPTDVLLKRRPWLNEKK